MVFEPTWEGFKEKGRKRGGDQPPGFANSVKPVHVEAPTQSNGAITLLPCLSVSISEQCFLVHFIPLAFNTPFSAAQCETLR